MSFPRKKESRCLSERARAPFYCVLRQNPGQVRAHVRLQDVTLMCGGNKQLLQPLPSRVAEEVTYRWIYNEFPLFLHPDRRRFVSQKTGNLYISKVEAQDAGNYSCFVSSPVIGRSVFSKFIPLVPLPPDEGQSAEAPLLKVDCLCFLSAIFDVP